jgi:hypothetical protein
LLVGEAFAVAREVPEQMNVMGKFP